MFAVGKPRRTTLAITVVVLNYFIAAAIENICLCRIHPTPPFGFVLNAYPDKGEPGGFNIYIILLLDDVQRISTISLYVNNFFSFYSLFLHLLCCTVFLFMQLSICFYYLYNILYIMQGHNHGRFACHIPT